MTWEYPLETLEDAWIHTSGNAMEVFTEHTCRCVGCLNSVHGGQVLHWVIRDASGTRTVRKPEDAATARCPKCNQESVLSSKDKHFPILNPEFMRQLNAHAVKMGYVQDRTK